jgi:hypothetical protein
VSASLPSPPRGAWSPAQSPLRNGRTVGLCLPRNEEKMSCAKQEPDVVPGSPEVGLPIPTHPSRVEKSPAVGCDGGSWGGLLQPSPACFLLCLTNKHSFAACDIPMAPTQVCPWGGHSIAFAAQCSPPSSGSPPRVLQPLGVCQLLQSVWLQAESQSRQGPGTICPVFP